MKYFELKTQKEKVAFVKQMLAGNPAWAVRGLLRIYAYQTESEKIIGETTVDNGVGFSGADAHILSSFADQIKNGRQMTEKQMAIIYKKMPRYSRQLVRITENTQTNEQT
jgi:hypothetical protein